MCLSYFFAQVLGCYLFLICLAMLVHQVRFKRLVHELASDTGMIIFSGACTLAVGLILVISHNIWVAMWPVLITLIGWFMIFHGLFRVFWPEHFSKLIKDMATKNGFLIWTWVWLIIGLYLIWVGFGQMQMLNP